MKKSLSLVLLMSLFVAACDSAQDDAAASGDDSPANTANAANAANAADADSSAAGDVVAVVNGVSIPASRITLYAQRPALGAGERTQIIDNMIVSELIAQAARSAGFADSPAVREELAIAEQAVLGRAYAADFLDNHPVTDEARERRYQEIVEQYAGRREYDVSHILVADEALANELLEKIHATPADFADLARENSADPGSAPGGGALGWVIADVLAPEFGAAMEALGKGEISSAPVKTDFGWHIIRVNDSRSIVAPALDDAMRERLTQAIRAESLSEHISELRERADIKTP